MKKRNILFAILLAMTMLITACGAEKQSLEGKWVGTLDVTKQFTDGIKAGHPTLAEYVEFEDLVFVIDVAFEEGQMSLKVREDSIDNFTENFAAGMEKIALAYWEDGLAMIDLTLEEAVAESGMSEEDYLEKRIYKETGIDKMISSMTEVTHATLDKLSSMEGTYQELNNELRLWYDEENYENMDYAFKGKKLNITIKGNNFSLLIQCEKEK